MHLHVQLCPLSLPGKNIETLNNIRHCAYVSLHVVVGEDKIKFCIVCMFLQGYVQ